MTNPPRKLAFILASTEHGAMIVNRFDEYRRPDNSGFGVGFQLLENAVYDPADVTLLLMLLDLRRRCYGDGLVAIDCGANIGVHSVEWARHMTGWGIVRHRSARAHLLRARRQSRAQQLLQRPRHPRRGEHGAGQDMRIPNPNYLAPGSFGSLEQFIGQAIDYSEARMVDVSAISLDAFNFPRLDLIKMDVEGMELEALAGAIKSIQAHRPMMLIGALKVDGGKLRAWLEELNYSVLQSGINLLAIHKEDECLKHLKIEQRKSA